MLSDYISAHKVSRTVDLKPKMKTQDGTVMLGLSSSQIEEFSAIKKYPSE